MGSKTSIPLEDHMYKINVVTENLEAFCLSPPPFGPGLAKADIEKAVRVEVWGTSFGHREEFVDFYLFDSEESLVYTKRVFGY